MRLQVGHYFVSGGKQSVAREYTTGVTVEGCGAMVWYRGQRRGTVQMQDIEVRYRDTEWRYGSEVRYLGTVLTYGLKVCYRNTVHMYGAEVRYRGTAQMCGRAVWYEYNSGYSNPT